MLYPRFLLTLMVPLLVAIAFPSTATIAQTSPSAPAPLTLTLGDNGIASLRASGVELVADGTLRVVNATLTDAAGAATDADLTPRRVTRDVGKSQVTVAYSWGSVECQYLRVGASRVDLTIGVQNDAKATLTGIAIQPLEVAFPSPPKGWVKDYAYFGDDRGNITAICADFGTGTLAVCNDDFDPPLLVGFPGRSDLTRRPLVVCTANYPRHLSPFLDPFLHRPIPPGGYDTFHLSLRLGPTGATETDLASDLYREMAKKHPSTIDWNDRRAIGTLHLATSEPPYHSPTNPRGWFSDPKGVNVTTPAGLDAFHARLLQYADASIAVLKTMNAQGMVTWDLEGQEFPHATSYIGDPRLLPTLDPEMDSIADAYFRKFHDAGLRTGVCVRPQLLRHTPEKTEQTELAEPARIVDNLFDKIAYAHKRWGCTLFYVDSNGDPNVPYDPALFESLTARLRKAKIDALVMPEHRNLRYYACTAPYGSLRNGFARTPDAVRAAYPRAFIADYVPDAPLDANHDALLSGVKAGDLLMFRGWWNDPVNDFVRGIYREAAPAKVTP